MMSYISAEDAIAFVGALYQCWTDAHIPDIRQSFWTSCSRGVADMEKCKSRMPIITCISGTCMVTAFGDFGPRTRVCYTNSTDSASYVMADNSSIDNCSVVA